MSTFAICGGNCVNAENPMSSRRFAASVTSSRSREMVRLLRRIWPLGIRTQLMLWYIVVFAVLILLFGAVFYVNLSTSLSTSLDTALQLRTQQIAAGITEEHGKISIQDVTGELPGVVDNDSVQGTG